MSARDLIQNWPS